MCSFAAKWKAVNDTANPQNEDGNDKVKKKNTFILWLVSATQCSLYQSISSLTMRADICWCILEAVIPFADVGITTIWPTLLRVVNNRACLHKICLYYNWSKVLGTTTVVYLSSVDDRLRPLSFCLVPRELLSWSPITFVHTGCSCWETLSPLNLII